MAHVAVILCAPVASAQEPVRSGRLGVTLPAAARADNGILVRAAARATLGLSASTAGVRLGNAVEVYRLPLGDSTVSAAAIFAAIRAQHGTVRVVDAEQTTGVATTATGRHLVLVSRDRRTGWLYIGEVTGDATVAAAPAAPAPAAPASRPPVTPAQPAAPSSAVVPAPVASAPVASAPPAASVPSGAPRYQLTTTRYADGWSATEYADHVRLTKGPYTVWLWHRVPITESMRPPVREVRDVFWARDVAARFTVGRVDDRVEETRYSTLEYREAEVTTQDDARPGYVGMSVLVENGTAQSVVVLAPDRATFRALFPTPDALEPLAYMNRFGVMPSDLPGTWSANGGAYVQLYYVTSGLAAGMQGANMSDEFTFLADGTYRSRHVGSSSAVGRQTTTYSTSYAGRWQLNGIWELVLTDRYGKATSTFEVSFASVTGGRVLRLTNTQFSGERYQLGRKTASAP